MIVVGQLLAVFMANAGGAWDRRQEDDRRRSYGVPSGFRGRTRTAVTRRTRGRSAQGHRRPRDQSLIKVMNMVSLLALGLVMKYCVVQPTDKVSTQSGLASSSAAPARSHRWAIWQSKRESKELQEMEKQFEQ